MHHYTIRAGLRQVCLSRDYYCGGITLHAALTFRCLSNDNYRKDIGRQGVMEKTVGIAGLGIMGGAIAANLLERGWSVVGYDVSAEQLQALAANGLVPAPSIAALAQAVPIILTSLPSPAAAHKVAGEIAASGAPSRIVVEASTLAIADKLAFKALLEPAGHIALDCPLSGTGAQAKMRDLVVYASGEPRAIAECKPLFADFARQSADLGAYGNGSRMKFVANLLVAIHNVAAAEAMLLAKRAGLDLAQVIEMVGPGAGGSRMFQMRAPMMADGVYEPATMRISTWKKDMEIIGAFADGLDCPTPLFMLTKPIYAEALEMGLGDQDTAAVFEVLGRSGGLG
jgi:3-hydroxyisobutyrate dehydrogenase-like beta-hydroxyacid dehydrogenase